MSEPALYILGVLLFPVLFFGFSCLVLTLLAEMSGWRRLAEIYPAPPGKPAGKIFGWQSGKVGMVGYNQCLTIHSGSDGLQLAVMRFCRFGHTALFIPWDKMENAEERRFLWKKLLRFEVGSLGFVTLQLPREVFEGSRILEKLSADSHSLPK